MSHNYVIKTYVKHGIIISSYFDNPLGEGGGVMKGESLGCIVLNQGVSGQSST